MNIDLYFSGGKIYTDAQKSHLLRDARKSISYGDSLECALHFAGEVQAGDELILALDADMLFGVAGTSPMALQKHIVTADDLDGCTLTLSTNTERFYDVVNGMKTAVSCYFGVYAIRGKGETAVQIELGLSCIWAMPVVATDADNITPIKPADAYYTKEEADATFLAKADAPDLPFLPLAGGSLTGGLTVEAGGIAQLFTLIDASATEVALEIGGVYRHAPTAAPTYTLPDVDDPTRTAEIVVSMLFSANALSVAFENSQGAIIAPLTQPEIKAGKTIVFLCEFQALQSRWVIEPIDMGEVAV